MTSDEEIKNMIKWLRSCKKCKRREENNLYAPSCFLRVLSINIDHTWANICGAIQIADALEELLEERGK